MAFSLSAGNGYSYSMINQALGIAKSTLSNWFKDRYFTPNKKVIKRIQYGPIKSAERKHNIKVGEVVELRESGARELGKLTTRDLWLLGLGLYIGEGTKSHEIVRIINSNPEVAKLTMKWFKDACGATNDNIVISVHLYPDNDAKKCLEYWGRITGLPASNFRKTQVDRRKNKLSKNRGKLPYGTAHITIIGKGNPEQGVRLHRRISGWIAGALSQV